jgi:hypothetical protein
MTGLSSAGRAVDRMFPSWHVRGGPPNVESAVRVAGGFPTLGGGLGATARPACRRASSGATG